jgi:hypothetical protein
MVDMQAIESKHQPKLSDQYSSFLCMQQQQKP